MTPEQIESAAYELIFNGAESYMEDWIDEGGDYSREDYEKIFAKSFELLRELRKKYLYAS